MVIEGVPSLVEIAEAALPMVRCGEVEVLDLTPQRGRVLRGPSMGGEPWGEGGKGMNRGGEFAGEEVRVRMQLSRLP